MLARDFANAELIDYAPEFNGKTCSEIIAASGLLTAKPGEFKEVLENIQKKTVLSFHREATKRGHASLLTTPTFYFWVRGSRAMDFYFTSFPFGSYLMFSSRRIPVNEKNLLLPFCGNEELEKKVEKCMQELLSTYRKILVETGKMDYARRILPIGFTSYGFMALPLQTILAAYEECKKYSTIPQELKHIAEQMFASAQSKAKEICEVAELAYLTGYPHANIFCGEKISEKEEINLIYKGNLESVAEIFEKTKDWKKVSTTAQSEILLKCVCSLSLAAWNDLKRHRTARMRVESIYKAVEDYLKNEKEERIHIPEFPEKLKFVFLNAFRKAMELYEELISAGVEKSEAIYVIPHALKVKSVFILDGYHVIDPFGMLGIRACSTADYEVRKFAFSILEFCKKVMPEIAHLLGVKCKLGFCPERESCGLVEKYRNATTTNL